MDQQEFVKDTSSMAAYCIGRKSTCVFVSFLLSLTICVRARALNKCFISHKSLVSCRLTALIFDRSIAI